MPPQLSNSSQGASGIPNIYKAMQECGLPEHYPITTQKMSEMELKILEVIKGNRSLSRDKIAETLGNITSDGVKYHLSSLQKKGLLKRVGGRKEGYWEVLVDIQ